MSARSRRSPAPLLAAAAWMIGASVAFIWLRTPRLTSTVHADPEVAGLPTYLAAQLASGKRLYVDSLSGTPPLGIGLMRALQSLLGRVRLVDELWAIGVLRWIAAGAVGAIAARFGGVALASCVAGAWLGLSFTIDAPSMHWWLAAAASFFAIASALGESRSARLGAGFAAACAFGADQATGLGAAIGVAWCVFSARSEPRRELAEVGVGALGGLAVGLVVALSLGATPIEWARVQFVDGFELAGHWRGVLAGLAFRALGADVYPMSLVALLLVMLLALRVRALRGQGTAPLDTVAARRDAALVLLGCGLVVGLAAAVLTRSSALPSWIVGVGVRLAVAASLGVPLVVLLAALAVFARRTLAPGERRLGDLAVAAVLASFAQSLGFHVTDQVFLFAPLAVAGLLVLSLALEAARLRPLWGLLGLAAGASTFGPGLARAVQCDSTQRGGYFDGLALDVRGRELVRAATEVQRLTRADEAVLVLPEDPQLTLLIGRPRPPVRGALLFVDQYPSRLLAADFDRLLGAPPRVLVLAPPQREIWERALGQRAKTAAAARLALGLQARWLGASFEPLPATFRMTYARDVATLELWVRP